MSIREALMEMAKPKTERAAWVPESILDDDVSHFMGAAAAAKKAGKSHFDFGGKKYKVTMKHDAAKKIAEATFATDIDYNEEDNIKKVAKRFGVKVRFVDVGGPTEMQMTGDKNKIMKAVKALGFTDKEIKNAYFKESAECPTCGDGECQCEQPVEEAKVDEVSYKTAMKSYQKAMGQSKDADTAGDKETGDKKFDQAVKFGRYANKKFQSSRNKKKLVGTLSRQVPLGTLTKEETVEVEENYTDKQDASYRDEPTPKGAQKRLKALHKKALAYRKKHGVFPSVRKRQKDLAMKKAKSDLKFESVEEATKATAQHKPTAETSDTWDKQLATRKGEKEFIDKHEMDVALDAEKMYDQNKYEAMKKTPVRNGDKTDGDKKVVNPLSTDMVTGMRKALAQMKLSGE